MKLKKTEEESNSVKSDGEIRTYFSIDPGLSGTGVAVWNRAKWGKDTSLPMAVENVYAKKYVQPDEWSKAVREITNKIEELVIKHSPCIRIYCEWPAFMCGSGASIASNVKGDINKLAFLIGSISNMAAHNEVFFMVVPVHKWKGQLPKEVVKKRIIERIPKIETKFLKLKSHSWDAVGIGLYAKGVPLQYY